MTTLATPPRTQAHTMGAALLALLLLLPLQALAQPTLSAWSKLVQARAADVLANPTQAPPAALLQRHYLFVGQTPATYTLRGLALVDPELRPADLQQHGIRVFGQAGPVWSVELPLAVAANPPAVPGWYHLALDHPLEPTLDSVLVHTRTDSVHAGTGLARGYTGQGVVLGVHDIGFDYRHPSFRSPSGAWRLHRAWHQFDSAGNPPTAYPYGSEYADSTALQTAGTDYTDKTHGTHVAGIAGGSSYLATRVATGLAPEADLVFSSISDRYETFVAVRPSTTLDGVKYGFDLATQLGQPAVVNMSLGAHLGPHDGTSLMDRGFANLTGPGRVLVGSAGNSGRSAIHLMHTFANDSVRTLSNLGRHSDDDRTLNRLDAWARPGANFRVELAIRDTGGILRQSGYLATADDTLWRDTLVTPRGDTLALELATTSADSNYNGQANATSFVWLVNHRPGVPQTPYRIDLGLAADSGTVHLWNDGPAGGNNAILTDGTFFGQALGAPYVSGDSLYTVGEVGGSADSVITVGAYTTLNVYRNFQGLQVGAPFPTAIGDRAPFSSIGPRPDGTMKPDIVAPGNRVVSAISSYNTGIPSSEHADQTNQGGRTYPYAGLQGTSMSAPVVAGMVALLLQADPNLGVADVRRILRHTAVQDSFTGTIDSTTGNRHWGWGKVDMFAAMIELVGRDTTADTTDTTTARHPLLAAQLTLAPNPATTQVQLLGLDALLASPQPVNLLLLDATGRPLRAWFGQAARHGLDLQGLPTGLYRLVVQQGPARRALPLQVGGR